jgi:hypothetical protein
MYSMPRSENACTVTIPSAGGRKQYAFRIRCGSPPLSTSMLALGVLLIAAPSCAAPPTDANVSVTSSIPAKTGTATHDSAIRSFRIGMTERAYPKLIYYNKLDKGGHFAAWEQPKLFAEEIRAVFKSLR